jgi:hypothetical protein
MPRPVPGHPARKASQASEREPRRHEQRLLNHANATALSRGLLRWPLPCPPRLLCQCHGLEPWSVTCLLRQPLAIALSSANNQHHAHAPLSSERGPTATTPICVGTRIGSILIIGLLPWRPPPSLRKRAAWGFIFWRSQPVRPTCACLLVCSPAKRSQPVPVSSKAARADG